MMSSLIQVGSIASKSTHSSQCKPGCSREFRVNIFSISTADDNCAVLLTQPTQVSMCLHHDEGWYQSSTQQAENVVCSQQRRQCLTFLTTSCCYGKTDRFYLDGSSCLTCTSERLHSEILLGGSSAC